MEKLYKKIGYRFKRIGLLNEAFRHSSYVNELKDSGTLDNERLEFLGDSVLGLAISHILMDNFQDANEGSLSKFRAMVVSEKSLFRIACDLNLGDYIFLGKGEEITNGRKKPSILANTVEALLGAIYLDSDFDSTKDIIHRLFLPLIERIDSFNLNRDHKSMFQEYTQNIDKSLPEYILLEENGPPHDKTFRVAVCLNGEEIAQGIGKSKKEAEQRAAREALSCLGDDRITD
jgi:ribonuclease III